MTNRNEPTIPATTTSAFEPSAPRHRALRGVGAGLAALALGLGLAACAGGASGPEAEPPATGGAPIEVPTDDGAGDGGTDDGTTGGVNGGGAGGTEAAPAGTAEVRVNPVVVEGVTGLLEADDRGDDRPDQRQTLKLITGPGGCLAFETDGGAPILAVFDDDDEVLSGEPGIRADDRTVRVGESVEWEYEEVALAQVDGIPAECRAGANEVVYLLDG